MNRKSTWEQGTRFISAALALAIFGMFAVAAHHYSTLIESLMQDPLVTEWQGPAAFRVGTSPTCGDHPCWIESSTLEDGWQAVNIPKEPLAEKFKSMAPGDHAYYRFPVTINALQKDDGDELAFSPNWVVHRRYQIYVDGQWVAAGHGATKTGDIVYQKVVIPLPRAAVERGHALVAIEAEVGPQDIGIQHLGRIMIGPTTTLSRLHVEAEFAMGSYYLVFLAAEAAVFVVFVMVFLLARTRRGFGTFVTYAFLMTAIHLAIGNFLEGILPFNVRIWMYFLAKGGATSALAFLLSQLSTRQRPRFTVVDVFVRALSLVPLGLAAVLLITNASIATMHSAANLALLAVLAAFVAWSLRPRAVSTPSFMARSFALGYLAFLTWNVFVHASNDFDYRPLADLAFFYAVAWMTMAEFGVVQARAGILAGNMQRLQSLFGRLVGGRLARHLTTHGSTDTRDHREVTMFVVDLRYTERLMRTRGVSESLAVVDEFIRLAATAVQDNGGDVTKILGDKLVAVWGLTEADPRGPIQAVQAGLALRTALHKWNENRQQRGEIHLSWAGAITHGRAVVGRIGAGDRTDYAAFGPVVGRAFRHVDLAKSHGVDVVLDGQTLTLLAGEVIVEILAHGLNDEATAATFVGLVRDGEVATGDQAWQVRFGTMRAGGRVFDAGANQETFLSDTSLDDKAA